MSRFYIGLATSGHDPSFAIVNENGNIIFAESTERFLQDKRAWGAAPDLKGHIEPVLKQIIADHPEASFKVATTWKRNKSTTNQKLRHNLQDVDILEWIQSLQSSLFDSAGIHLKLLCKSRIQEPVLHYDHHLCHAVAAVSSAPFDNATCLVLDGHGEVGSASLYSWAKGKLNREWRSWGPGSLGAFYSWLTDICRFDSIGGEEWKVMGLAAYGKPQDHYTNILRQILTIESGKPVISDLQGVQSFKAQLMAITPASSDYMDYADLAASGQAVFAEFADQILRSIYQQCPNDNLIYTGGCALNSSYNGSILSNHEFKHIHVPSAPGDDGNAVGAALLAWQDDHPKTPLPCNQTSPYLGIVPAKQAIEKLNTYCGLKVTKCTNDMGFIAQKLAAGNVIGVMRGRAEFGPRALGNRSILADPRSRDMKDKINRLVKGREAYRPFAPIIIADKVDEWFENAQPAPYMSYTLKWREDKQHLVPAVVHKDGTGRLQTVSPASNPWLYSLAEAFDEITGVPVILNTSLNVMGKPIVHTVNDAVAVLMTTGLDALIIDDIFVEKHHSYNDLS